MASLNTSLVRKELKAIAAASKLVKKRLFDALEKLEEEPSSFPDLEDVPPGVKEEYPSVRFLKIKIEHDPHSFRLIAILWQLPEMEEHVDVIYAFRRKDGYAIDWEWVDSILADTNV